MRMTLAFCLFASTALMAAADSLDRPKGCALVATEQDDHCAVQNYFQCTGAGTVAFRVEVYHGGGDVEVHSFDANHGGVEILMPSSGAQFKLSASGDHPSTALKSGSARKTESATILSGGAKQKATMVTDYTYDGETRALAGETFHRLTYASTLTFPASGSVLQTSGSVLFNERLDLLVNEVEVSDGEGGPARKVKLKSLSLEGQKGFGAAQPKFGCRTTAQLALSEQRGPA